MGIDFKTGIELGNQVTLEGLRRGFDAILLTVGELAKGDGEKLGVPLAGAALKADPATCRLSPPNIFAAGACVKPVKQVVRAMAEGRAAAECVHRYLRGQPPRRPEKPFSSIMGRLEPGELREFLRARQPGAPRGAVRPLRRAQPRPGAARGGALPALRLPFVGQLPAATLRASLWRRRQPVPGRSAGPLSQQLQPGGVIFEPGKCIVCGICVKLTEMAAEPLGLSFVGRGFDMRVAAPFDRSIEEGLGAVAEECVRHCPTGALAFADKPHAAGTPAETTRKPL